MVEGQAMVNGVVLGITCAAADHFLLSIRLPMEFATPSPGQFVMIRESARKEPLLARPLSVFGFMRQKDHGVLELLFRACGRGTSLLARMKPGEEVSVLGPLGRGFTLPLGTRQALFVAGGIGVAPLAYLLRSALFTSDEGQEIQKKFYLGARSAELLTGVERIRDVCEMGICTDDGSHGYHGPVTAMLAHDIDRYDRHETIIYACGPTTMTRALKTLIEKHPIPCQVSLEERMACGIGACLGCAAAILGPGGEKQYRRVCQDGPIFDLREVLLAPPGDM